MENETLLDKAVSDYRLAIKNYMYSIGDERELNLVGYLLQQSLEIAIKHFLETSGIRYSRTHAIEDLLDECEQNHVDLCMSEELYQFAPAITKWESKTRYIKDFLVSKKQIETGFRLIFAFLVSNGVAKQNLDIPNMVLRDNKDQIIEPEEEIDRS